MFFDKLLSQFEKKFSLHDSFYLCSKQSVYEVIKNSGVPDLHGVYIIYGCSSRKREIIYIGKGGLIKQDGTEGKQKLRKRLTNEHAGKSAKDFYRDALRNGRYSRLFFRWFVTFDSKNKLMPAKVEGDLIQAYYDDFKHLPRYNKQY